MTCQKLFIHFSKMNKHCFLFFKNLNILKVSFMTLYLIFHNHCCVNLTYYDFLLLHLNVYNWDCHLNFYIQQQIPRKFLCTEVHDMFNVVLPFNIMPIVNIHMAYRNGIHTYMNKYNTLTKINPAMQKKNQHWYLVPMTFMY